MSKLSQLIRKNRPRTAFRSFLPCAELVRIPPTPCSQRRNGGRALSAEGSARAGQSSASATTLTIPQRFAALEQDQVPMPATIDREGYYDDRHLGYWLSGIEDLRMVRKLVPEVSFRHVLDFGGATGRFSRHVVLADPSAKVTITDLNVNHVEWVEQHFGPSIRAVKVSPYPYFPLADGSVTLCVGLSVFTHIDSYESGWLAEIHRVLADGGYALLTIHSEETWRVLTDAARACSNGCSAIPSSKRRFGSGSRCRPAGRYSRRIRIPSNTIATCSWIRTTSTSAGAAGSKSSTSRTVPITTSKRPSLFARSLARADRATAVRDSCVAGFAVRNRPARSAAGRPKSVRARPPPSGSSWPCLPWRHRDRFLQREVEVHERVVALRLERIDHHPDRVADVELAEIAVEVGQHAVRRNAGGRADQAYCSSTRARPVRPLFEDVVPSIFWIELSIRR